MKHVSITLTPGDLLGLRVQGDQYRTDGGRSTMANSHRATPLEGVLTVQADADELFALSDHFHRLAREVSVQHNLPPTDPPHRSDGETVPGEHGTANDVLPGASHLAEFWRGHNQLFWQGADL